MPRGTRRSKGKSKEDSDSDEECYSGEGVMAIEEWFEFDKKVERYCRKTYGDLAVELWEQEHKEISQDNVEIIAAKTYDESIWVEGKTEADKLWHWSEFWTIPYQIRFRRKLIQQIFDYIEEHSKGRF